MNPAKISAPIANQGGTIDISPEDGEALGLDEGDAARVSSRRGSVVAPVAIATGFPDRVPAW